MATNSQYQQFIDAEEQQKKANEQALKTTQKNLNKRLDNLRFKDVDDTTFNAGVPHDSKEVSFVSCYVHDQGQTVLSAIKLYLGDVEISGSGLGIYKAVKVVDSNNDANSDVGWEYLLSTGTINNVHHDRVYNIIPETYSCAVYKGAPMCRFLYELVSWKTHRGISCPVEPSYGGVLTGVPASQKDGYQIILFKVYREGSNLPETLTYKIIFGQQMLIEGYVRDLAYYYIECNRYYNENGAWLSEDAIYVGYSSNGGAGTAYNRTLMMQGTFDENYGLTVLTEEQYNNMPSHNPNVVYKVIDQQGNILYYKNEVSSPENPVRPKAPILTLFTPNILADDREIYLVFCNGNEVIKLDETYEEYYRLGLRYSLTDGSRLPDPILKLSEDATKELYYEDIALILNSEVEPS